MVIELHARVVPPEVEIVAHWVTTDQRSISGTAPVDFQFTGSPDAASGECGVGLSLDSEVAVIDVKRGDDAVVIPQFHSEATILQAIRLLDVSINDTNPAAFVVTYLNHRRVRLGVVQHKRVGTFIPCEANRRHPRILGNGQHTLAADAAEIVEECGKWHAKNERPIGTATSVL
ncbi:MAG: hypothetical protein QM811_22530 [Pirellulales bacterium]